MNKKVMIVDDALLMQNLLKKIILKLGYEVCAQITDVDKVIEKYRELKPDIVFMDLILDDEEEPAGLNLIEKILAIEPSAKIIVISALKQEKITEEALRHGSKNYINKPFNENKIKTILENL